MIVKLFFLSRLTNLQNGRLHCSFRRFDWQFYSKWEFSRKDIVIKTLKVQTWKDFSRICGKISPENYPWRNPFFSKVDSDGGIGICNKIVCLTIADKYRK